MDKDLTPFLKQLADRFGTNIEHMYGVLVRQAVVEAWANVAGIVFVLLLVAGYLWVCKWYRDNKDDLDEFSWGVGLTMVGGGLACAVCIAIPLMAYTAATGFLNPEYAALRQVLGALK